MVLDLLFCTVRHRAVCEDVPDLDPAIGSERAPHLPQSSRPVRHEVERPSRDEWDQAMRDQRRAVVIVVPERIYGTAAQVAARPLDLCGGRLHPDRQHIEPVAEHVLDLQLAEGLGGSFLQ